MGYKTQVQSIAEARARAAGLGCETVDAATVNRIYLYLERGTWVARFVGPHAARIRELFNGADTLPTPYTAEADRLEVWRAVAVRNPGCAVVLES